MLTFSYSHHSRDDNAKNYMHNWSSDPLKYAAENISNRIASTFYVSSPLILSFDVISRTYSLIELLFFLCREIISLEELPKQ